MWEAEPVLYWRVKRNGKWRFERTRFAQVDRGIFAVEYPRPPANDGGDESE